MALELLELVGVVAAGGAGLVVADLVDPRVAQVAAVNDLLLLGMPGEADALLERVVDVIDEPALGGVDQLHRLVAAGADQLLAVEGEDGPKHPVGVGLELHEQRSVGDVDAADDLVGRADGHALPVGRDAQAVERVAAQPVRLDQLLLGRVPDLHRAVLGGRAPGGGEELAVLGEGDRLDPRHLAHQKSAHSLARTNRLRPCGAPP